MSTSIVSLGKQINDKPLETSELNDTWWVIVLCYAGVHAAIQCTCTCRAVASTFEVVRVMGVVSPAYMPHPLDVCIISVMYL